MDMVKHLGVLFSLAGGYLMLPTLRKPKESKIPMQLQNEGILFGQDLLFPGLHYETTEGVAIGKAKKGTVSTRNIYINDGRIQVTNATPVELYLIALHKSAEYIPYNRARISMTVYDEKRFFPDGLKKEYVDEVEMEKWRRDYGFHYDRVFSLQERVSKWALMLNDLNQYFGKRYRIAGSIEKVPTDCLLLKHNRRTEIPFYTGKRATKLEDGKLTIQCNSIDALVNWLDNRYQFDPGLPIIDRSYHGGGVVLTLKADFSDFSSINEALIEHGLSLQQEFISIERMVIRSR
ncbi:hypothetical protein MKQ70_32620 [Chitinophaga sedimenti]|uniref:hypothetical protein n=1 Tax=Chitinophaga sedimenti TaxID=2033606 RepID=UPI002005305D|nr:hypothetical protein [Chitinophaga sedimenti]MCK7559461.1 hypothetical protein [Chitinophaga sedimenti]